MEMTDSDEKDTFLTTATLSRYVPWALLAILLGVLGYWLGMRQSGGPGDPSAEAGMARDMITHHAQAVDMATLIRDRSEDGDMRQLAIDIMLTQQGQIGQMQGWLNLWGYPVARTGPAMAWMDMPTTGLMPGMATPEQINQLRGLHGEDAEVLFLDLMIAHHRSGVEMARAALERAKMPEVRSLAQSMVDGQTSEIALMEELLQQRGINADAPDGEMEHSP